MEAITTHDLTKVYRSQLRKKAIPSLDSLNLTVHENEVFGFLGRNGAGKTTTIKLLCSLLRPTRGEARIFGSNARACKARGRIGYLPENPYFYEYLTPRETLDFYGQLHGLSPAERAQEWAKLSELLDLRDIADSRVGEFSKGMRQRLGCAVALVGNPDLLILDEPMSGLDPLGRRAARELIIRLRDEGKTIFFSSHVLADVEQICNRVGILVKGRLTAHGALNDLLTARIQQVEVIIAGLDHTQIDPRLARATHARESEQGRHLYFADLAAANDAVRAAQTLGGVLVEFNPVRESLEDYFVRHQESQS